MRPSLGTWSRHSLWPHWLQISSLEFSPASSRAFSPACSSRATFLVWPLLPFLGTLMANGSVSALATPSRGHGPCTQATNLGIMICRGAYRTGTIARTTGRGCLGNSCQLLGLLKRAAVAVRQESEESFGQQSLWCSCIESIAPRYTEAGVSALPQQACHQVSSQLSSCWQCQLSLSQSFQTLERQLALLKCNNFTCG